MRYNFAEIENKWKDYWDKNPLDRYVCGKPDYYCLDMFPYPSGNGLHVGHGRNYVLSDVVSRYKIMQGYNVLHPMGWDAFGLPAENYAIKQGTHPETATNQNIKLFKEQLNDISTCYDWDREFSTTDPEFYKWTQWIFAQMYKQGLAYEKEMPLNWCPDCKAVLSNEEATNGECERCGATVTKKMLRQWMLKITNYAERLLSDLDLLDWPEKVKKMQSDWIGKSYGAEVDFGVENSPLKIKVFTTRPDTLYGATFIVLSPEHALVKELTAKEQMRDIEKYIFAASTKSSVDRMTDKEKTGVFTGCYGINPLNNKKIPIWISDYVLADYGTGAIMCVPAHDQRDFEFAKKFGLEITQVIIKENEEEQELTAAYAEEGIMINSDKFNGIKSSDAKELVADYLETKGIGKKTVNYKLRDWVFSRQRYWGEPIPLVHCEKCGIVVVPNEQLPVLLPAVDNYQPTETGESPLAAITDWVNCKCPKCNGDAKRETNTMPQWAGSSWYFLRYADPRNSDRIAGEEALKKWMPVSLYVGGIEHAVLHLLYARFYTKFLYDIGAVEFTEPFSKLFCQGMIYKDGAKMSKSKGNVISPGDLISEYGRDAFRMYELFIAPPELDCEWDDSGIEGTYRYLTKVWKLYYEYKSKLIKPTKEMEYTINKLISDVNHRFDNFYMNTVVSALMEHTNKLIELAKKENGIGKETLESLILMLAPIVPHIAEEMWEGMGHKESIFESRLPICDESKLKVDSVEIALQINGKVKETLVIGVNDTKDFVIEKAKEVLANKLNGKQIVKEIYVPKKIVNIVLES